MQCDSFAIGLLPFFACETESARFDKMVPYNGLQLLDEAYDSGVVERAQRHAAKCPLLCTEIR